MESLNKRPSFAAMTFEDDYLDTYYIRDLKQNYAKRKDNIKLINSTNELALAINDLVSQMSKNGGDL